MHHTCSVQYSCVCYMRSVHIVGLPCLYMCIIIRFYSMCTCYEISRFTHLRSRFASTSCMCNTENRDAKQATARDSSRQHWCNGKLCCAVVLYSKHTQLVRDSISARQKYTTSNSTARYLVKIAAAATYYTTLSINTLQLFQLQTAAAQQSTIPLQKHQLLQEC
jgi:hypothetical protein